MKRVVWTGFVVLSCLVVVTAVASAQTQGERRQARIEKLRERVQQRVQARIDLVDTNRDGVISRDEWPGRVQRFDRLDRNHDGVLTAEELRPLVLRRLLARQRALQRRIK